MVSADLTWLDRSLLRRADREQARPGDPRILSFAVGVVLVILLVIALIVLGIRYDQSHTPEEGLPAPAAMSADGVHPQLIAHAGGDAFGYRLTNSKEALDKAYAGGFRFIEVDFSLTTDYGIVLLHDWDSCAKRFLGSPGRRTLEQFQSDQTMAGLTLLDLDGLLEWMRAHPDVTIITDTKDEQNYAFLELLYGRSGDLAYRFLPQAYNIEEYYKIRQLGFEDIILTLYKIPTDVEALVPFAAQEKPWAVTVPVDRFYDELMIPLAATGVPIYAHAVNSVDFVDAWSGKGLTGIYTDYFTPDRWLYGENGGVPEPVETEKDQR